MRATKELDLKVRTTKAGWQIRRTDRNALHIRKSWESKRKIEDVSVFPNFWGIYLASVPAGRAWLIKEGKEVPLAGNVMVYVPPFGLIRWATCGRLSFDLYTFATPPPVGGPPMPALFRLAPGQALPSAEEAVAHLRQSRPFVEIGAGDAPSSVAKRTKSFLDEHFRERLSMAEIADALQLSRFVMARYFGRDFGLSPVEYRIRLRLMATHVSVTMHQSPIAAAALDAGFGTLGQYYDHFRRFMGASPSRFRFD